MAYLSAFCAIIIALAGIVFFAAGQLADEGPEWAANVCSAGQSLCDNPQYLFFVAIALVGLGIVVKIVSVIRG
jgi:hypothetical protein